MKISVIYLLPNFIDIKECVAIDNKRLHSDLDDQFTIVTGIKSILDKGAIYSICEDVAILRSSMSSTWSTQMLKEMFICKNCLDLIGCELCIDT